MRSRRDRTSHMSVPMSQAVSSIEGTGDNMERGRGHQRCRIPRMMSPSRCNSSKKTPYGNYPEVRPKSAFSRFTDASPHQTCLLSQTTKQYRSDKERPVLKRPSNLPKIAMPPFRPPRTVIKVPDSMEQRTIPSGDDRDRDMAERYTTHQPCEIDEPACPKIDKKMQLKIRWQDNIVKFESIKRQLIEQQRCLLDLYAILRSSQQEMLSLGQTVDLPPPEDLTIMNISKIAPEQILQLCAKTIGPHEENDLTNVAPYIDINALHKIPNNIVVACEQTLDSRKEIIDWFEEIIARKMITKTILITKINHFKIENEEFKKILDKNKEDYTKIFNETIENLKKNTTIYQLRSESFANKLTAINAANEDLKNKLRLAEQQLKCTVNKSKVEDLEKELREEKYKKTAIRDRLSRADIQVKIKDEKNAQLKSVCEQVTSRNQILEKTVCSLREEIQKLQSGYDSKMHKLNDSINKNTKHLEEIMADKSKLLTEKQDLEMQLQQLSKQYEEALDNIKHETNVNLAKLIESEKKYNEMTEEKKKLEDKVESLCAELRESELRFKEVSKQLSETVFTTREYHKEIEALKSQLNDAEKEPLEYKELATKQTEALKELEQNWKSAVEIEELLKRDLSCKENHILELEKQRTLLEQRLQDSESKTESYAVQLSNLKNHISKLQEQFGAFENWEKLHELVKQQTIQLREVTDRNSILSDSLTKKDIELQQQIETVTEQRHLLEERDAVIKVLRDKDEEQNNVIKLLRNNLEMKSQSDEEFNQQIAEKNAEIESLIDNLQMRKQQISQLEKIIVTLENQTLKLCNQKRRNRETILALEKKLAEYSRNTESPTDNLDDLINILERELEKPLKSQFNRKSQDYNIIDSRTFTESQNKQGRCYKFKSHPENKPDTEQSQENLPTKIVMGSYVKKTYIPFEDKHKGDNAGRKKAITSMESSEWATLPEIEASATMPYPSKDKKITISPLPNKHQTRNIPYCLIPNNYIGDEKKIKMFKFAGHRLQ